MSVHTKFTLRQLLQIALGAPELTNDNIVILHSLIDLILKKLDCQNETITIGGFESKSMQRILQSAKLSPLAVNSERLEIITKRINALEGWEHRIRCVEKKLECHLDEIRKQYEERDDAKWSVRFWEFYSQPLEDLCTTCEAENEIACSLLNNKFFIMKLLRRIAFPIVERLFALEQKVEELYDEFMRFLQRIEEILQKVALIDTIIIELEKLRQEVHDNYNEFIGTMEEVQDMLDAKFDKLHVPAMKKCLKEKFAEISATIAEMKKVNDCPRATGVIMENIRCMSCLNKNVAMEKETAPMIHPEASMPMKVLKPNCGCKGPCLTKQPTLQQRMSMLDKAILELNRERTRQSCSTRNDGDLQFVTGYDGNLYRKG